MSGKYTVQCPCCKGKKIVEVFDQEWGEVVHIVCMHCEGTGEIDAEVSGDEDGDHGHNALCASSIRRVDD